MISCEEFLAEFGDYLENQVSPEVRQELELHVSQCRACHVLYDSSRKTVKLVTESNSFELPESVSEPIIAAACSQPRHDTVCLSRYASTIVRQGF
jgi:hypothetical protein